jgi:hypothetical protein
MRESRRKFFANVARLSMALPGIVGAQNPPTPPPKPQPAYTPNPAEAQSQTADPAAARRARLLLNEKEFREGVEQLFRLASSLRDELEKIPTTEVFSLRIVKQTEQIEKLAKLLKSRAKAA